MQDKHLYEYAVIRIVPCVEKEEFINTGIILYCASLKFLDLVYAVNEQKLNAFAKEQNISEIQTRLKAYSQIAKGSASGGTIATMPIASRFRWLASTKSTVLQTSAIHPGLCINPHDTMMKLFNQLVS